MYSAMHEFSKSSAQPSLKTSPNGESQSPEQIKREILSAIAEVRSHPFDFGFRYGILANTSTLVQENGVWKLYRQPQSVDDAVWHGNCVQDAVLSARAIQDKLGDKATVTIQYLDVSDGLRNSKRSTDHYRVLVEAPQSDGIMEYVDHSPFHRKYLTAEEINLTSWIDLTDKEASEIDKPNKGARVDLIAYTEYALSNSLGVAFVSINNNPDSFSIQLAFYNPEADLQDVDYMLTTNIKYTDWNKQAQLSATLQQPFFTPLPTDPRHVQELKPKARIWFAEIISKLPDTIVTPNMSEAEDQVAEQNA